MLGNSQHIKNGTLELRLLFQITFINFFNIININIWRRPLSRRRAFMTPRRKSANFYTNCARIASLFVCFGYISDSVTSVLIQTDIQNNHVTHFGILFGK